MSGPRVDDPQPADPLRQLHVRVPRSLFLALKVTAARNGVTLQDAVKSLLNFGLGYAVKYGMVDQVGKLQIPSQPPKQ